MKKNPVLPNLTRYFRAAEHWFSETPLRALDLAYDAALMIKTIEDRNFNGEKIAATSTEYGDSVYSYFKAELSRNLDIIKVRLAEFRSSRSFIEIYQQTTGKKKTQLLADYPNNGAEVTSQVRDTTILEKLKFIDEVLAKYTLDKVTSSLSPLSSASPASSSAASSLVAISKPVSLEANNNTNLNFNKNTSSPTSINSINEVKPASGQTSFLPRSILRTLDRVKRELDPKAEEEVVKEFRTSKTKTLISLKFILLIILIPLLTQQLAKNFLVGPAYDKFLGPKAEIFLNLNLEEEAFRELKRFEEKIKFESFIASGISELGSEKIPSAWGKIQVLSEEEIEKEVKDKALEIAQEYSHKSANAVKNVFADVFSLIAFAAVIVTSKREIEVLKSFMDDIVYGLSDSAKAFIIILLTDVFVGFHSPHGWEVILEGVSRHLGIPESREFIFLFIATFPVILDTVFKYWIFRYLNRLSPSAVATYKNMNE